MIHSNGPLVGIILSKNSLGCKFSISRIICPSNHSWIVTPDHKFKVESLVWLKGNPELSLWVNRVCGVGSSLTSLILTSWYHPKQKLLRLSCHSLPFYSLLFFQCFLF